MELIIMTAGGIIIIYATVFADIDRRTTIWINYVGACVMLAAPFVAAHQLAGEKNNPEAERNAQLEKSTREDLLSIHSVQPVFPPRNGPVRIGLKIENHSLEHLELIGVDGLEPTEDVKKHLGIEKCQRQVAKTAIERGPVTTIPRSKYVNFTLVMEDASTKHLTEAIKGGPPFKLVVVAVYTDTMQRTRVTRNYLSFDSANGRFHVDGAEYQKMGEVLTRDELTIKDRPSLDAIDQEMLQFEAGKLINFQLAFHNNGAAGEITEEILGMTLVDREKMRSEIANSFATLPPLLKAERKLPSFGILMCNPKLEWVLDEDDYAAVKGTGPDGRTKEFCAFGMQEYTDDAGGVHWTKFCYIYDGTSFRVHDKFNEVDTNGYGEVKPVHIAPPEHSGSLTPGDGTPIMPVELPDDAKKLADGMNALVLGNCTYLNPTFTFDIFKQGDEPLMTLRGTTTGVLFSGKFFDKDGKIMCEVIDNNFQTNPLNVFRIERTEHFMSVIDMQARPALTLEFISPRVVRVFGEFFLRGGVEVVAKAQWVAIKPPGAMGAVFSNETRAYTGNVIFTLPDPEADPQ
jgi:hypothetical protein